MQQSAEQLMRSRYSAFAKQQIDYIVQTTALGQQQAFGCCMPLRIGVEVKSMAEIGSRTSQ